MKINRLIDSYKNPELDQYLYIKNILMTNSIRFLNYDYLLKLVVCYEKNHKLSTQYYGNFPISIFRTDTNKIPFFCNDKIELISNGKSIVDKIPPRIFLKTHIKFSFNASKFLKENEFNEISIRLIESGEDRKLYEKMIDTYNLEEYLEHHYYIEYLQNVKKYNFFIEMIPELPTRFDNFGLDNLLYIKILYHKFIFSSSRSFRKNNFDIWVKELVGSSVSLGKKQERRFLYAKNIIKNQVLGANKNYSIFF